MSDFHREYRRARSNVVSALKCTHLEARHWLVKNANLIVEGKGIFTTIRAKDLQVMELISKLAGPNGITLVKVMEVRSKEPS